MFQLQRINKKSNTEDAQTEGQKKPENADLTGWLICATWSGDVEQAGAEAEKLIRDAHLLEEAGCFALVLEKIPADLAARVASELTIPVIGIGAGGAVDGQVLVVADMLGMTKGFSPRFLRRYADLHTIMTDAIGHYVADVKSCDFPNETEQY